MAENFVNTIEELGDEIVLDLLITRNITEYKDNIISSIGQNAFNYCYYLTNVDLPNVTSIGIGAFNNCTALTSINVPKLEKVNIQTFNNTRIKTIVLPNATIINQNGFNDCIYLTKVDLTNVTNIYANAFNNSALDAMIIRRDDAVCTLRSTSAFNGTPISNGDGYIYVPASIISSYKTASNWSTFATQLRAIEDYPDICG